MIEDIALGVFVAIIFTIIGWYSRKYTHTRIPFVDPFLYILMAMCMALCLLDIFYDIGWGYLSDIRAGILYCCAVLTYIFGQAMCRPSDMLMIWERDVTKHDVHYDHWMHPIVWYVHREQRYLMPQRPWSILRSLIGFRDPLNLDLSQQYFTTSASVSSEIITVNSNGVIPMALADSEKVRIDCLRLGTRKVKDENGNTVRIPRYLSHVDVTEYTYIISDSVWNCPDTFWFDKNSNDDAITNAAQSRAMITRLENELKEAQYNGVVEHIKKMLNLDIDSPQLDEDITMIFAEEERRRRMEERRGTEAENHESG
ncbi:MAG: hypothetical protein WCR24_06965 [Candidatus Methanomethylophilaceae archaeon]